MADAEDTIATVRNISIIIAAAVVIISTLVMVAVLGAQRERQLRKAVSEQAERMAVLKEAMAGTTSKPAFQTLEDLMKPYKKHLLQSAFDLQSRLNGQLSSTFLYEFKNRGPRDHSYAVDSTTYFVAEFFGWLEVIRRQVVFITGSEYAESLNSLLDSIRFQLTGETPIQGCRKGCMKNDDTFDQHSGILQLYIVDIRSIGNAMLHMVDNLWRPITVDTFLQCMNSDDPQQRSFKLIMQPLRKSIEALSELDKNSAPVRRIAIFQVLLCKLIDILDNAVPWDVGPKFDSNQEPRYIQRDMRMTPAVRFLSNLQKNHLQSMPFFDDDPNLSFPGFREDMKDQPQDFRDEKLWPGACPPQEPRQRDDQYRLPDQYTGISRMVSVWPTGLRRRTKRVDSTNTNNTNSQKPGGLATQSSMPRYGNRSEYAMQRPLGEIQGTSGKMGRRTSMQLRGEFSGRLPSGQTSGQLPSGQTSGQLPTAQGSGWLPPSAPASAGGPAAHAGGYGAPSPSPLGQSPSGGSGSVGSRAGAPGLVVSVPPAELPGAVTPPDSTTAAGHGNGSVPGSGQGPGGGGGGGGFRGVTGGGEGLVFGTAGALTRAELPISPGSTSPGGREDLAAGPGCTKPAEHLLA